MDAQKLIAFASYTTVGGAIAAGAVTRNCSMFYNGVGDVFVRVGTPGPLTAANTPAGVNTEWSRAITNLLPIVVVGTAGNIVTVAQTNSTTYDILAFAVLAGGAAESAVWFGLFQIAV